MRGKAVIGLLGAALVVTCNSLAAQNWTDQEIYLDRGIVVMFSDTTSGQLYAGGNTQWMDGQPVDGVIQFDGQQWSSVPLGNPIGAVRGIVRFQGKLVVCGFVGIGIWDGNQWQHIVTDGPVMEARVVGDAMLFSGRFYTIGGDSITSLASWNGLEFSDSYSMGATFGVAYLGVSRTIEFQGQLYAAGNIDLSDGRKEIMRWNGSEWTDVGGGVGGGGSAWINDMEVYQGELYVGGYFEELAGSPGNNIAKWNGQHWERVGEGLGNGGQVTDLFIYGGKLYASGTFSWANGVRANCIATWDGSEWCTLGHQIDNAISCMASYHDELYIGGGFWTIDDDSIRFLAKWNGGNYVDSCSYVPVGSPDFLLKTTISLHPNPTHSALTLTLESAATTEIQIHDLQGRAVLPTQPYRTGEEIDVSALPAGLYFLEVQQRNMQPQVIKFVKE